MPAMCRYAMEPKGFHFVCLPCRKSFKHWWQPDSFARQRLCPQCRRPMINAGHDFAPPRRSDKSGWVVVAAVLGAGLRYEGFETCGCGREPKFRPRTKAQLRERRVQAARAGIAEAIMLAARDPYDAGLGSQPS